MLMKSTSIRLADHTPSHTPVTHLLNVTPWMKGGKLWKNIIQIRKYMIQHLAEIHN